MISKGMLAEAKDHAAWNVRRLLPYAERGIAIVGLEPSCLLTFRDEYPNLLREESAKIVARQTFLLCAKHVRQFGGESPLPNLMEVKG